MGEAVQFEFPTVAGLPQRIKTRVEKARELLEEFSALGRKHGGLIPSPIAMASLNVSSQRMSQLFADGRLPSVMFRGHRYVPQAALEQFLQLERPVGRPVGAIRSAVNAFKAGWSVVLDGEK